MGWLFSNEPGFQSKKWVLDEGLTAWAWSETAPVHRNKTNLLIHLLAVPLFVAAHFLIVAGALMLNAELVGSGIASVVIFLALQKYGHTLERQQVHVFLGAKDFIRRLYAEQFCNFWRFLFSGQWRASLRSLSDH